MDLSKFNSSSLDKVSQARVKGGMKTYVVSAPREGDGTITDAAIEHDGGLN
jgi:hypothetical protein